MLLETYAHEGLRWNKGSQSDREDVSCIVRGGAMTRLPTTQTWVFRKNSLNHCNGLHGGNEQFKFRGGKENKLCT